MAGGLNRVSIIGNLGKSPEMRYLPNGQAVTSFSVAVGRQWTTEAGEKRDETEWFRVVAFAKLAEVCNQLLDKGRKVFIEGRLQTRQWEGQDGQKRSTTEVVATTMLLLDSRPGQQNAQQDTPAADDDSGEPF